MSKYYPPKFEESSFNCTHSGAFAKQSWAHLFFPSDFSSNARASGFQFSRCDHCQKICFWYEGRMVVPSEAPVTPPHKDLPESCIEEYNEARDIVSRSPRAAAALLSRSLLSRRFVELVQHQRRYQRE